MDTELISHASYICLMLPVFIRTAQANPDSAQPNQEEEMPTPSSAALEFLQSVGRCLANWTAFKAVLYTHYTSYFIRRFTINLDTRKTCACKLKQIKFYALLADVSLLQ